MKRIISVILVFVLCFSLAACDKKENTDTGANNQNTENTNTVLKREEGANIITGYKAGDLQLPTYKGLTYTPLSTEPTEEEIEDRLNKYASSYKVKTEITDRDVVQKGDIIDIEYLGKKDGEAFEGGTGSNANFTVGSSGYIADFENGIIGKSKGTFTIDATFPESYKNADLAIRILKKWDKENLYLLVDVYDDVESVQYSGVNIWDGDCVQVSVDPLNDGSEDIGNGQRRGYRKDDFEIGFANTALGSEGYQWSGPDLCINATPEWVNVSRDVENRLTRYFIALPANKFNLKLEEGADVAFNVAVNEADVLGRELWEQITLGTADDKQPDQYYDYKLVMPTTKDYEVSITENALPK